MSLQTRIGKFGTYIGNTYDSSNALNQEQMEVNAKYIALGLYSYGWTKESIAALLGNMQAESSINPGRWQSDRVGGDSSGHGYSLVQWTPYIKYTNWCSEEGYSDPSEMDSALARIVYEVENSIQWAGTGAYSGMSFLEFSKSTEEVGYLAVGLLICYERTADQSESVQEYRSSLARKWYEFLGGVNLDTTTTKNKKRRKYKFVLFNRKRRGIYG